MNDRRRARLFSLILMGNNPMTMGCSMREVVIVDSVRTGLAKSFRGKFNLTRPDDMAAHCVNALLARTGIDPALVDDCIVGAGSTKARRA